VQSAMKRDRADGQLIRLAMHDDPRGDNPADWGR
jgi:hypothetical protein